MSIGNNILEHQAKPIFGTTRWTIVMQAGQPDSPDHGDALAAICKDYWYPLYGYARRQGFDVTESQDLTQEFFARLLEKNYLGSADRRRGRFRAFLITAFKCFLANEWDRARSAKRGGGQPTLSFDEIAAEGRYGIELASNLNADQHFDRSWAMGLIDKARARLREEYEHANKGLRFELLQHQLTGTPGGLSRAEIGGQLGLTENAVKQELFRMKKLFGEFLRAEVARTVAHPDDVDEEIRYLVDVACRE